MRTLRRIIAWAREKSLVAQVVAGLIAAALFAAIGVVVSSLGSESVGNRRSTGTTVARRVEIEAYIGIANAAEEDWRETVTASIGQRIAVLVGYNNREFEDSGRTAKDVLVRIEAPEGHRGPDIIAATVGGKNATRSYVSVGYAIPEDATLQYVPGSATLKHNPSNNDEEADFVVDFVDDRIVETGLILEDVPACINCGGTVRVFFDVVAA